VIDYLQAGDAGIQARHQPALVLDYARSREASGAAVLKGTGMEEDDFPAEEASISAAQYLLLLKNVARHLDSADTSFMLGQRLLPGHFGSLSHALLQAPNLRQALLILCGGSDRLCPLLKPRWREEGAVAVLHWMDSFGAPAQLPFLVEMHMAALTGMCRWLAGERLPWRFCFNRARPRHVEQYEVHLGQPLAFDAHLDAMLIDAAWLDRPWPRGSAMASSLALRAAVGETAQGTPPSLLNALYDYLEARVRTTLSLETTAADFGVSTATLKRHLSRAGTHFQAELDQVRAHVALRLFRTGQYDNEAAARYLGFHDAANFRRSFKRWTGQTPGLLRSGLFSSGG
jgi:AraC-like DNA-binding protein